MFAAEGGVRTNSVLTMKADLSLSTCWCSHRHTDGYAMLEEIAGLGFSRAELSHGIRISLLPGIYKAVEDGVIKISSVHNFCPLPPGIQHAAPNIFQPSAMHRTERQLWYRHTLNTLRFAHEVGASRVVIHSGSAWFFLGSPEARMDAYLEQSKLGAESWAADPRFQNLRDRALNKTRKKSRKGLARVTEAFQSVLPELEQFDLQFGVEIREGMEEFPLDEQMPSFLQGLGVVARFGYWHDIGHAQLKHLQGVIDHEKHLETMRTRLAGFHIHDVSAEGRDHQVPGTGTVDFTMVRRFMQPGQTHVLELSPRLSTEQILKSRDFVHDLMDT